MLPRQRFTLHPSLVPPSSRKGGSFILRSSAPRRAEASRESGFTLIELLVVISIIIVLMGLLFPAFKGAQDQVKKTQAKNDVTQIVNAVNAFYTEYGKYPLPGAATSSPDDYWITDSSNGDLFNVMRANGASWDNPSGFNGFVLNPRRIAFMQIPYAKDTTNPRSGISSTTGKYYDPWGNPYRVRIDWDYDNALTNPYAAGAGATQLNLGVIAYSIGKDNVSNADSNSGRHNVSGQTNNGDDDVLSWAP